MKIGDDRGLEQGNVGPPSLDLSPRFYLLTVFVGIGSGLGAIVMMAVLRAVQHAAFGYTSGKFVAGVTAHDDVRRLVVLLIGGLVTGLGLWIMKSHLGGTGGEPTEVVWTDKGSLSLWRTLLSGGLSEITVGMGASLGREAAPQRTGAALGAWLARRFALPRDQRRLLIACGAGAGLAAVYNVPLAGALFVAEIYFGTIALRTMIPALLATSIATFVAWIALAPHALYNIATLPAPGLSITVFALLLGPLAGLAAAEFVRLIAWASDHRPSGLLLVIEPVMAFGILGLLSFRYPLLLGNGTDLAQFALTGSAGVFTLLALFALKPLVTTSCLRSGASGGLFTPTLSFGAIFGLLAGHLWSMAWPGSPDAGYGVIAAAAVLAAAAQAPITGAAFIIELAPGSLAMVVPVLLAVVGATIVSRKIEIRSIYSARLALNAVPDQTPDATGLADQDEP